MTTLNPAQMDEIAARHPAVFHRSFWQRFRVAIIAGGFVLYALYCWWFFAIGHVLGNANWNLAGTYLADWVSYEVRPEVTIAPDGANVTTFHIAKPDGWPVGKYKLEVSLDGAVVQTREFEVK